MSSILLVPTECGRARIFHGVNAVEKEAPYLPRGSGDVTEQNVLSDADAELLQGLGMNLVRLGVLVVGALPSPGVVNSTYLEDARAMIESLADRGIATLVPPTPRLPANVTQPCAL